MKSATPYSGTAAESEAKMASTSILITKLNKAAEIGEMFPTMGLDLAQSVKDELRLRGLRPIYNDKGECVRVEPHWGGVR